MSEPPLLLDGARVLEFAIIDLKSVPAHRMSVMAEGLPMDLSTVSRLVIAEDLVQGGVFLLHCNDEWETLTAGHYPDAEAARQSVQGAYAQVTATWTPYRALTAAETAEVETTRAFLREIAAEFPDA
jgi:hypothetical protein